MRETAIFGGGCFWCTEAVFQMLWGVTLVEPGYAGGTKENPSYDEVSTGKTGYVEVVRIEYDPSKVAYRDLLTVLFASHDPTSLNRQGNDVGTQYRSVIFYTTEAQREECEKFITELNQSSEFGTKIVTAVEPMTTYYSAEEYHKDYYAQNPYQPYCEIVINPKLEKVKEKFAALLKDEGKQK